MYVVHLVIGTPLNGQNPRQSGYGKSKHHGRRRTLEDADNENDDKEESRCEIWWGIRIKYGNFEISKTEDGPWNMISQPLTSWLV